MSDDKVPVSLLLNKTVTADEINDLCIAQNRHTIEYLDAPCDKHFQFYPKLNDRESKYKTYTSSGYYPEHRYLCHECMREIKEICNDATSTRYCTCN
jgi:hypothetical protein